MWLRKSAKSKYRGLFFKISYTNIGLSLCHCFTDYVQIIVLTLKERISHTTHHHVPLYVLVFLPTKFKQLEGFSQNLVNHNSRGHCTYLFFLIPPSLYCWFSNDIFKDLRPGSSVGIATDYGLDGPESNPGGDQIFRPSRSALWLTQPPVIWVPGLSRGVKCGRGVLLTTHPLLVPRSWKSRAIPLPTLWATPGL